MFYHKLKDALENHAPRIFKFVQFLYAKSLFGLVERYRKYKIKNEFDCILNCFCTNKEIKIWPVFGTLLGIYRDNGPISHDNDIDLGAWLEDRDNVKDFLTKMGCKRVRVFFSKEEKEAVEEQYIYNNVLFDVFYFSKIPEIDETFTYDFMREGHLTRKETIEKVGGLVVRKLKVNLGKIEQVTYKTAQINFPSNVRGFLLARYGDDYMTPNSNWVANKANEYVEVVGHDGVILDEY